MRPQDLLHIVGFDFNLLPNCLHPNIIGVQVTKENDKMMTIDIRIANQDKPDCRRFVEQSLGYWRELL